MLFSTLKEVLFLTLTKDDIASLMNGMAYHIDDHYGRIYFVAVIDNEEQIEQLKCHPDLKDRQLLLILRSQIPSIVTGNLIVFKNNINICTVEALNKITEQNNIPLKKVSLPIPKSCN